jgi:hypothetical protein
MMLEALMNAATYPDADHSAPAAPRTAKIPAVPCASVRLRAPASRMSRTGSGVMARVLSSNGWMADWPAMPSTETRTSSPGKIDRMV